MKRIQGFSLIEVLVSIVILSIALLGTAGLMSASLRNTNTSYYRSQATVLADDILDRMRANLPAAEAGEYDMSLGPVCAAGAGEMATYDCEDWGAALAGTLPSGKGKVERNGSEFTVVVQWNVGEDNIESFTTRSHL